MRVMDELNRHGQPQGTYNKNVNLFYDAATTGKRWESEFMVNADKPLKETPVG